MEHFFSNPEMFRELYIKQSRESGEESEIVKKAAETADKLRMLGTVKSEMETKHASNSKKDNT
jgi:hypothetical protein